MHKSTTLGIGREVSSGRILETLNNSRLSAAIVADYHCQGAEELDHVNGLVVEGPDAAHGHLYKSLSVVVSDKTAKRVISLS